ncbi:MAG: hypothetical protein ACYC2T_08335 [Bacillota bacterium]
MKRLITILILLAFAVLVIALVVWRTSLVIPILEISEKYLNALGSGNAEEAMAHSSGAASQAALRLKGQNVQALVKGLEASVKSHGRGWAKVLATVDLLLEDGTFDVGWYSLELVQKADGWKVIAFRETEPVITGSRLRSLDTGEASGVFLQYIQYLADNRYNEAARLLAGPARKAHEQAASVLSKAPFFKKVSNVEMVPVWHQGKFLKARAEYTIDERRTMVMVLFYKTKAGLRIIEVTQG